MLNLLSDLLCWHAKTITGTAIRRLAECKNLSPCHALSRALAIGLALSETAWDCEIAVICENVFRESTLTSLDESGVILKLRHAAQGFQTQITAQRMTRNIEFQYKHSKSDLGPAGAAYRTRAAIASPVTAHKTDQLHSLHLRYC